MIMLNVELISFSDGVLVTSVVVVEPDPNMNLQSPAVLGGPSLPLIFTTVVGLLVAAVVIL